MRAQEPPVTNEHGEPVCPHDGTVLDLHSDGEWWCWKCGSTWDLDAVVDPPAWPPRKGAAGPTAKSAGSATLGGA